MLPVSARYLPAMYWLVVTLQPCRGGAGHLSSRSRISRSAAVIVSTMAGLLCSAPSAPGHTQSGAGAGVRLALRILGKGALGSSSGRTRESTHPLLISFVTSSSSSILS